MLLTSCAFFHDTFDFVGNIYSDNSMFTVTEYNPETGEKPRLEFKGYEDIDLKLGSDEFYIRKTIKLTDFYLDSGRKFRQSEDQRAAKEDILTMQ